MYLNVLLENKMSAKTELIKLVKLEKILPISLGSPLIKIGVIDGNVDFEHPEFKPIKLGSRREIHNCKIRHSISCLHGTFMMGILSARRSGMALGLCPQCKIVLRPVFVESVSSDIFLPSTSPTELSNAIVETVDAGAKIINLSIGLAATNIILLKQLNEAYEYARSNGVIIVIAAGNLATIGYNQLISNRWLIPVIACDNLGNIFNISNINMSIKKYGVMSPGVNLISTSPGGKYTKMSGTSAACTVVTGIIALLWSIFPETTAEKIVYSIRNSTYKNGNLKKIIPGIIDGQAAYDYLISDRKF
jgi:hypothetical protein